VHGDVKPSNILITHGTGKIADLGLAGPERLHGATWGTPSYSPPEREHGVFVFAGDVYSFALTIEQSLHGHEGVPPSIGRVLDGALVSDYQRRPTLARLLADLQQELDSERARPEIERRLAVRELEHRRRRTWLQTAVVVTALVSVGGTMAIAGVCSEPSNLELAERAAERRDGVAAVQNLELAMRQGKLDGDEEALREIAIVAEQLGGDFLDAGERVAAHDSWWVASECYSLLGDEESAARVDALVAESAVVPR
jgi:serine/threonine protein kinase